MTPARAGAVWVATVAFGLLFAGCHPTTGRVAPVGAASGEVVLPPDYDPARAYPVVEVLPATGSTAEALLQIYLVRVGLGRLADRPPAEQLAALAPYLFADAGRDRRGVIVVLVRGRGSAEDYRTPREWEHTIARYERQVLADLRAVAAAYRVDASRQIVTGFSLGGDLSWAIALRNPRVIHGAVVMASRATYRPDDAGASAVRSSRVRFVLTMGDADQGQRQRLARAAAHTLDGWGVPNRIMMLHGVGHEPAPPDVFAQALAFVLAP
jgi:dienelactone hydrolase